MLPEKPYPVILQYYSRFFKAFEVLEALYHCDIPFDKNIPYYLGHMTADAHRKEAAAWYNERIARSKKNYNKTEPKCIIS